MSFYVYLLRCRDGTLYCGSTKNLERRVREHQGLKTGARYTKARRPVELVYSEKCASWSEALRREWALKRLKRVEKLKLITG